MTKFDYQNDSGPKKGYLKCNMCGFTTEEIKNLDYKEQGTCCHCFGSMMGYFWGGWKVTPSRKKEFKKQEKELERRRKEYEIESVKPEFQESEPFENFTDKELTIANGLVIVKKSGTVAPWLGPYGACLIKVYGVRRKNNKVEFGVGNEKPPILAWITAGEFYTEWPD